LTVDGGGSLLPAQRFCSRCRENTKLSNLAINVMRLALLITTWPLGRSRTLDLPWLCSLQTLGPVGLLILMCIRNELVIPYQDRLVIENILHLFLRVAVANDVYFIRLI
jgi:hypothetical protein